MEVHASQQVLITATAKAKGILPDKLEAFFSTQLERVTRTHPGRSSDWCLHRAEYLTWEHFVPGEPFPGRIETVSATRTATPPISNRDSSSAPTEDSQTKPASPPFLKALFTSQARTKAPPRGPSTLTFSKAPYLSSPSTKGTFNSQSAWIHDKYHPDPGSDRLRKHTAPATNSHRPRSMQGNKVLTRPSLHSPSGSPPVVNAPAGSIERNTLSLPPNGRPTRANKFYLSMGNAIDQKTLALGIPRQMMEACYEEKAAIAEEIFADMTKDWQMYFVEASVWHRFFSHQWPFPGIEPPKRPEDHATCANAVKVDSPSKSAPQCQTSKLSSQGLSQTAPGISASDPSSKTTSTTSELATYSPSSSQDLMESRAKKLEIRSYFFTYLEKMRFYAKDQHRLCSPRFIKNCPNGCPACLKLPNLDPVPDSAISGWRPPPHRSPQLTLEDENCLVAHLGVSLKNQVIRLYLTALANPVGAPETFGALMFDQLPQSYRPNRINADIERIFQSKLCSDMFTLAPEDERVLNGCFGRSFKGDIVKFHRKVLANPGVSASSAGEIFSKPLEATTISKHSIQTHIRRIFGGKLCVRFIDRGRIRCVVSCTATTPRSTVPGLVSLGGTQSSAIAASQTSPTINPSQNQDMTVMTSYKASRIDLPDIRDGATSCSVPPATALSRQVTTALTELCPTNRSFKAPANASLPVLGFKVAADNNPLTRAIDSCQAATLSSTKLAVNNTPEPHPVFVDKSFWNISAAESWDKQKRVELVSRKAFDGDVNMSPAHDVNPQATLRPKQAHKSPYETSFEGHPPSPNPAHMLKILSSVWFKDPFVAKGTVILINTVPRKFTQAFVRLVFDCFASDRKQSIAALSAELKCNLHYHMVSTGDLSFWTEPYTPGDDTSFNRAHMFFQIWLTRISSFGMVKASVHWNSIRTPMALLQKQIVHIPDAIPAAAKDTQKFVINPAAKASEDLSVGSSTDDVTLLPFSFEHPEKQWEKYKATFRSSDIDRLMMEETIKAEGRLRLVMDEDSGQIVSVWELVKRTMYRCSVAGRVDPDSPRSALGTGAINGGSSALLAAPDAVARPGVSNKKRKAEDGNSLEEARQEKKTCA
ncbi:hypothetical protein BUE80_DR009917 [Diplocarpon rosae]|nr:hypothetical protein BUE80_DR009917 [Diplocarpon rosae]